MKSLVSKKSAFWQKYATICASTVLKTSFGSLFKDLLRLDDNEEIDYKKLGDLIFEKSSKQDTQKYSKTLFVFFYHDFIPYVEHLIHIPNSKDKVRPIVGARIKDLIHDLIQIPISQIEMEIDKHKMNRLDILLIFLCLHLAYILIVNIPGIDDLYLEASKRDLKNFKILYEMVIGAMEEEKETSTNNSPCRYCRKICEFIALIFEDIQYQYQSNLTQTVKHDVKVMIKCILPNRFLQKKRKLQKEDRRITQECKKLGINTENPPINLRVIKKIIKAIMTQRPQRYRKLTKSMKEYGNEKYYREIAIQESDKESSRRDYEQTLKTYSQLKSFTRSMSHSNPRSRIDDLTETSRVSLLPPSSNNASQLSFNAKVDKNKSFKQKARQNQNANYFLGNVVRQKTKMKVKRNTKSVKPTTELNAYNILINPPEKSKECSQEEGKRSPSFRGKVYVEDTRPSAAKSKDNTQNTEFNL